MACTSSIYLPTTFFRNSICYLMKIFIVVFFVLNAIALLPINRSKQIASGIHKPIKDVLQTYNLHFRLPAEESRLESVPLNWIDIKISPYPQEICKNLQNNSAIVLFVIHSRNNHFEYRSFIRTYYLKAHENAKFSCQHLFVVAVGSAGKGLVDKVKSEAENYKDLLVIQNVEDHYHNISHKVRAWVSFLSKRCTSNPVLKYIVKLDDDVMLDMPALLDILPRFDRYKNVVLCRTFLNGQITRSAQSKWYLSKQEYKPSSLGMYCQGMAYVFSSRILKKMAINMERVQYLWMDDWYASHALMNATGAAYFDIGAHYVSTNSRDEVKKLLTATKWKYRPIFGHFRPNYTFEEAKEVWSSIQKKLINYADL